MKQFLSFGLLLALAAAAGAADGVPASQVSWKKTVVEKKFRSEGVAIADVNKDGKMDILAGDIWYEAPHWKMHEIRKVGDYGDGLKTYSECMCCWADDVNGDGWQDQISIGFPGKAAYWYENPQGKPGHWKEHVAWPSACNETPLYVDLFGTGKRVLVMGWQPEGKEDQGQMAYFKPGKDPTVLWEMHPISVPSVPPQLKDGKPVPGTGKEVPGTRRFSHGLGVGDVNGDGRLDVICTGGWWEQPASGGRQPAGDAPWKFHPANLGDACADMYAHDMDGDGKADVLSTSAHRYGIWCHHQKPGQGSDPSFLKADLFKELFSESHALHFVDINGDGLKDLVTGKRFWSHGRNEPGANLPAVLYWFEARKTRDGITTFVPHEIDNDSGIGTQFVVADFNGDKVPDIVVSSKKGTYVFEQLRGTAPRANAANGNGEWSQLFNGKDLTGWETYLGKPQGEKEPLGLNTDPRKVYTVMDVDGKPAVRISGEVWGALTSKDEFENYHLKLEFKWGEKKWPPRHDKVRDSGLLYHCVGPHGAGGGFWMQSLECQIQEHDCGDFWSVAGAIVDVQAGYQYREPERNLQSPIIYHKGGAKFTVPRQVKLPDGKTRNDPRIIKSADYEKPTGEWNIIEVMCLGPTCVHLVNGKANMVLTSPRRKVGDKEEPLTKGKIQLQSEGAEVYYRNIAVRPLKAIPEEYLK